jgi:hypothetical protein
MNGRRRKLAAPAAIPGTRAQTNVNNGRLVFCLSMINELAVISPEPVVRQVHVKKGN